MKHIFLDTNVVIDFLADRQPFSIQAAKLFNFSIFGKAKIYISAVSYNNIYYILRQQKTGVETVGLLNELSDLTEIVNTTEDVIKKSLKTDFKDFEDAIQYYCAISSTEVEFIVTRDTKDFKKSTIPVMTPQEAVIMIEENRN